MPPKFSDTTGRASSESELNAIPHRELERTIANTFKEMKKESKLLNEHPE